MPGEKYHAKQAAEELRKLSQLAQGVLNKNGPGTPPDINILLGQASYINAPEAVSKSLCKVANMVTADPALTALYNSLLNFGETEINENDIFSQIRGPMEALMLFGALPRVRARHAALGVPDEITRDTFGTDLMIAIDAYASKNDGAFGSSGYIPWLCNHYQTELFKIGRLQYILKPYTGDTRVFVDDITGEIVLTAQPGRRFRGDGRCDYDGRTTEHDSYWESELTEDDNFVRSNCMFVNGRAIQTPVVLDKKVWRLALEEGIYGLDMHIPVGKGLNHDDCVSSLREAWRFFRQVFPNRPFETYYCGSWLLDPELQKILPPSSGIVQFQKLYRLYPISGSAWSFLGRGFGVDTDKLESIIKEGVVNFARTADRSTSLRRGMADFWLAGGELHGAAGVIHQYDVIRFGGGVTQPFHTAAK